MRRYKPSEALMNVTKSSARQWNQVLREIYKSGAWVRDEIGSAVADAVFSRAPGSLFATIRRPTSSERSRIVDRIICDLAKQEDVDKRLLKLSYEFCNAVDRIRQAIGKRRASALLSFKLHLDPRQIIRLGRCTPQRITEVLTAAQQKRRQ